MKKKPTKSDRAVRWALVGVCVGCVAGAALGVIGGAMVGHTAMENEVGGAVVGSMRGLSTGLMMGFPAGAALGYIAAYIFPMKQIIAEDGDAPVRTIYGVSPEEVEAAEKAAAESVAEEKTEATDTSRLNPEEK